MELRRSLQAVCLLAASLAFVQGEMYTAHPSFSAEGLNGYEAYNAIGMSACKPSARSCTLLLAGGSALGTGLTRLGRTCRRNGGIGSSDV